MTCLPAAPARMTLVEAPHLGDLSGVATAIVRVPVANGVADQLGTGSATTGVLPVPPGTLLVLPGAPLALPGEGSVGVIAGRIVARIVVLEARRIVRVSGVARC
jgi:hypothetical protein